MNRRLFLGMIPAAYVQALKKKKANAVGLNIVTPSGAGTTTNAIGLRISSENGIIVIPPFGSLSISADPTIALHVLRGTFQKS